jgi:hypothetical protein
MAMFPPELESTKHEGPPAPRPDIYDMFPKLGPRPRYGRIFGHAFLAFSVAFSVCVYATGGTPQSYVMAVLCALFLALTWARVAATLRVIYVSAAVFGAIALLIWWIPGR